MNSYTKQNCCYSKNRENFVLIESHGGGGGGGHGGGHRGHWNGIC